MNCADSASSSLNSTINFLKCLYNNKTRISALLERRQFYYEMYIKGVSYSEDKISGGSKRNSRVESAVIGLIQLETDIDDSIETYINDIKFTETIIDNIGDSRYRDILRYRYLNCWSWNKISRMINYDRTHVWRLHQEAIKAFSVGMTNDI